MSFISRFTTRNVGRMDRITRALPFAVFVYVWASGLLTGLPLIAFGVIAVMLLLTAITGLCSIYALLGLSTYKPHQS